MDRCKQWLNYVNKVFGLNRFLCAYRDSRIVPQIPAATVLLVGLIGIVGRWGSLHQLERAGLAGELKGLLGSGRAPSADTIARRLGEGDVEQVNAYSRLGVVRRAFYNKAFPAGTLCGRRIAAMDGSETYVTKRPCTKARETWSCRRSGQRGTEYYQRATAISYVGVAPRLGLGIERVKPGEDEVAAGLRLIRQLDAQWGWGWCDTLVLDSLYPQAPFLNELRRRHKHYVVKVKQGKRDLIKDAEGVFAGQEPTKRLHNATCVLPEEQQTLKQKAKARYQVELWDQEGFTSWDGLEDPVRCIKVREVRESRKGGEWVAEEPVVYHVITSLSRCEMPPESIWLVMHRRWDIENSVFNDLQANWHFGHCYSHDPRTIEMIYALVTLARNLMLLFAYRHLRGFMKRGGTLTELARQIQAGVIVGHCVVTRHGLPVKADAA